MTAAIRQSISQILFPQIQVLAGSPAIPIDFQMQYQSLSSPGNDVLGIVTVYGFGLDPTHFLRPTALFIIQQPSTSQQQAVDAASVTISPPASVMNLGDVMTFTFH